MIKIDFLKYQNKLKTRREDGKRFLYGTIRRKYLVLQPEELVRQLVIEYFIEDRKYNKNYIAVEKLLIVNERRKRCDILVYKKDNNLEEEVNLVPWLLVECKAPEVPINEATFRQIASYNLPLRVEYLVVTNGRETYCCEMNYEEEDYTFLEEIPTLADN